MILNPGEAGPFPLEKDFSGKVFGQEVYRVDGDSVFPVPNLEVSRLAEKRSLVIDPVGDPVDEPVFGDRGRTKEPPGLSRVTEPRGGGLGPSELDLMIEEPLKSKRDLPHTEDAGTRHVENERLRRRGGVIERANRPADRVPLPEEKESRPNWSW